MAEPQFSRVENETKQQTYDRLCTDIVAVLDGEMNNVSRMATISSMLHGAFDSHIWTGFYMVDSARPDELIVGPYQGNLGCLRIPFGKGVCGTAAETGRSQVVEDVNEYPGHISCDANSVSEVVVPVRNPAGKLIAVLDIDANETAQFDQTDVHALEEIVTKIFG